MPYKDPVKQREYNTRLQRRRRLAKRVRKAILDELGLLSPDGQALPFTIQTPYGVIQDGEEGDGHEVVKHLGRAREDQLLADFLNRRHGLEDYARFWLLLEAIASRMETKCSPPIARLSWRQWQTELHGRRVRIETFLKHLEAAGKVVLEADADFCSVSYPGIVKYRDERNAKENGTGVGVPPEPGEVPLPPPPAGNGRAKLDLDKDFLGRNCEVSASPDIEIDVDTDIETDTEREAEGEVEESREAIETSSAFGGLGVAGKGSSTSPLTDTDTNRKMLTSPSGRPPLAPHADQRSGVQPSGTPFSETAPPLRSATTPPQEPAQEDGSCGADDEAVEAALAQFRTPKPWWYDWEPTGNTEEDEAAMERAKREEAERGRYGIGGPDQPSG